jgi:hypothetical protein
MKAVGELAELAAIVGELNGTGREEATMFDGSDPSQYEHEARERGQRGRRRGAGAQSVIGMCPGWAATRSSQARIAG